jgi:hypothetical protein
MNHTRIRGNANYSGAAQTILIMAYGTSKEILGSRRISPALQAPYMHILSQQSNKDQHTYHIIKQCSTHCH